MARRFQMQNSFDKNKDVTGTVCKIELPETTVSDNGIAYTSKEFENFC